MRFPLDISDSIEESLLFWLTRYTKFKTNTLSSRGVEDNSVIERCLDDLNSSPDSFDALSDIVIRIRKGGIEGVKSFFIPSHKLCLYIVKQKLSSMREIDDEVIVDYLTSVTAGKSDATKKNYRNAITNFFGYLSNHNENTPNSGNGYIYHLELKNWQGLSGKSGNKLPAYLTEDEVKKLFQSMHEYRFISDRSEVFYNFLIRLILYSGVRISEALSIKRTKLTIKGGYVTAHITGKGNKARIIEIPSKYLSPYLDLWYKEPDCPDGLVFCSPQNPLNKASASSVSHKIKDLLAFAGIAKDKEGAHLLRHTYGTLLYKNVRDLALVQERLGHEDPSVTMAYVHIDTARTREAAEALGDLEDKGR